MHGLCIEVYLSIAALLYININAPASAGYVYVDHWIDGLSLAPGLTGLRFPWLLGIYI